MTLTPDQSWQSVLDLLKVEMPRAPFDKWLRDTHVMAYENGLLTIGVSSGDACEWLEDRLHSTISRMLVGIMDRNVEVAFVLDQPQEEKIPSEARGKTPPIEGDAEIKVVSRLHYEELVKPSKVVAIPGYFSRLIPEIGARNAWLYVGWRQAAWNGERSEFEGLRSQRIPVREVLRFSGLSRRTFFRAVEDESTWERLQGLVERQDDALCWTKGSDARSHRLPNRYLINLTLHLARNDAITIRDWLNEQVQNGVPLLVALKKAASEKMLVGELLPFSRISTSQRISHKTVMDITRELNGNFLTDDLQEAAEALHRKIIHGFGTILITHFFLEKVIPLTKLTPAQAWLVTLLRDRCFVNSQTGEVRDEVYVRGGYQEMANWLGLSRAKTIWEWFRDKDGPISGFLVVKPGWEGSETNTLRLKVSLEEPVFEDAVGTIGMTQVTPILGAAGTLKPGGDGTSGWRKWHGFKHFNTDPQNISLSTKTTTSVAAEFMPAAWVLRKMLIQNHAHPKVIKELLSKNCSGKALVSWLLFAYSPVGVGIKYPFAYAIANLKAEPHTGSGGIFDYLAALPPSKLIGLIDLALKSYLGLGTSGRTGCQAWNTAMGLDNHGLKSLKITLIGKDAL